MAAGWPLRPRPRRPDPALRLWGLGRIPPVGGGEEPCPGTVGSAGRRPPPPDGWRPLRIGLTRSPGLAVLLYWTPIVAFLVLTVLAVELEGLSLGWQLVVWTAAVVLVAVADAAAHRTSPESARTRQPAGRRARSR